MIKIAQIQVFSQYTGKAALRLHKAFLNSGIESTLITLKSAINDDEKIIQKSKKSKLVAKLDNYLQSIINRKNVKEFGLFSYPILGTNVSLMKEVKEADYIYVHWVLGGFLNLANIEQLAKLGKPVIFFMHDMWPITGGCHYSFSCEKYAIACYDCQIFPKTKINDLSSKEFKKKLNLYKKYENFFFISPSKWLFNSAKNSALTKKKLHFYIPNYIDPSLFKPIEKCAAREILNIEKSQIVISFGAVSIDNPYKGWSYLIKALKILFEDENFKNITILIFGSGYKKEIDAEIPYKIKFVGHLSDDYSTMLIYNASTVFIAPSLADNLPTTVLESLNCGTAVVGFNVGGIPDMIRHKENGYLAAYRDADDLCNGIKFCIENQIKGYALADFEPQKIIGKHLELFSVLASNEKK
jgi:glycosyltransferase involved in cell wall biosynthesis